MHVDWLGNGYPALSPRGFRDANALWQLALYLIPLTRRAVCGASHDIQHQ